MPETALILLSHGARDPDWAAPMHRVRRLLRQQAPAQRVELAFLEFMQPELRQCAESLLGEGCERIVVLPMFIAQGGHVKRDLPLQLDDLRRCHPRAKFELAGAVGEADAVLQAMAVHALSLVDR